MLAPQRGAYAIQDDIGDPRLDGRILAVYFAASTLTLEPALGSHNVLHIRNFGTDQFNFVVHKFGGVCFIH
jgi:hypothetical protein